MVESIDTESISDKSKNESSSFIFNLISLVFLLIIISIISFLFIPHSNSISIAEDIPSLPTPQTDSPYIPIDSSTIPAINPSEVTEGFDPPSIYKVNDTKPPKQRLPHPEDSDVDDLPFSRGMNPLRERKLDVLYRLASFLHPLHYSVVINVTVKGRNGEKLSTVNGFASIYFRIKGDASNILEFHTEGFTTVNVEELLTGTGQVKIISDHYNKEKRTNVYILERPMRDGEGFELKVRWSTVARDKGVLGLYETWENRDGTRAYQLATQGEIMGARKWMPLFDEPAMKANLSLTINHPSELNARSNAPVLSSNESSIQGIRTTVFSTTKRISPYLYAWSLTDYPEKTTQVNGITISVIANTQESLNISLPHAESSVKSYFSALSINQNHVFDKMDFVFIPDHVSAMENVGHITFGDGYVDFAHAYTHEMMHQYFGNLITLSWWDEMWINEGLTTMYENDVMFGIGTEEAIEHLRAKRDENIQEDSLRKTIALKNEVTTEVEAWANLGHKSYNKGAIVLYMIRNLIGEKSWKEGVETFLNKFAFQSVKGDDFLRTMKEVSLKYHSEETSEFAFLMAKDFFELKGFPIVTIKRNGRKMELKQVRFVRGFFGDSKDNIALSRHYWRIPIFLVKLDGTQFKTILMSSRSMSIEVDTDEELILDPKKVVYFRVIYDRKTYKEIAKLDPNMTKTEPIIHDLIHSSFSGYADPELAFDVIYTDFKFNFGPYPINRAILQLFLKMLTFDTPKLLRVSGLLFLGSSSAVNNIDQIVMNPPLPELCGNIHTIEDVYTEYSKERAKIILLFCPEVKNSTQEKGFEDILTTFLFGKYQPFHTSDLDTFIEALRIHYPNLLADYMVSASQKLDEHEFGSILHDVRKGFDIRHTEQLRQIFSNSPRATRENRDFITKIFNEHYAVTTEAEKLGEKIESELKKHLTKYSKSAKSKVFSSRKQTNVPDLRFVIDPSEKLQYY